jgi:uroporphyrinogen decarboxylase
MEELGINLHYISPMSDLAEAKSIIGQRGLTCGVIDDIQMIRWTPEQTRAEVKRLCEIGMVNQHFLFGTGVMPLAIPEANIRAMVDAAFEYGRYP